MIEALIKPYEYREITPYWVNRLFSHNMSIAFNQNGLISNAKIKYLNKGNTKFVNQYLGLAYSDKSVVSLLCKHYKTVTFQLGYSKNAKRMTFEVVRISIKKGRVKWGAVKGKKYFVIKLGNKL